MKKNKQKMNRFTTLISKNVRLSMCFAFELTIILGVVLTYYFLPILLNYGPRYYKH